MYLWDSNVLRYYFNKHPNLLAYVGSVPGREIALPSVVIAEVVSGRCEYVLKAEPEKAVLANELLMDTLKIIREFQIVTFDQACAAALTELLAKHKSRKRYADFMIAAIAVAGKHTVVTRNRKDFADLLPALQLQNWIDDEIR